VSNEAPTLPPHSVGGDAGNGDHGDSGGDARDRACVAQIQNAAQNAAQFKSAARVESAAQVEIKIDVKADNPSEREDYGRERIDKETLASLKSRSDALGLLQFFSHLGWIAVTGTVVWMVRDTLALWPAMLLHGIGIVFLFAGLHETVHRTPFASRWLNDVVARFCGTTVGLGAEFFRSFHFAHHRYTQLPGQDPEIDVKNTNTLGGYLYYMSGISYWIRAGAGLMNTALGKVDAPFIAPRMRPAVIREARWMVAFYALVAGVIVAGYTAPLLLWIIPMVLAQPMWRGWLMTEHTGCTNNTDIYANTRTTDTNPIMQFLLWQMPNHTAHHAYPGIPFHALGQTTRLLGDAVVVRERSYLAFHARWLKQILSTDVSSPPTEPDLRCKPPR
jgi:fatty acid desaturase